MVLKEIGSKGVDWSDVSGYRPVQGSCERHRSLWFFDQLCGLLTSENRSHYETHSYVLFSYTHLSTLF